MANYKVKLIDGHKARPDQNVNGYLGDGIGMKMPMRYTRGEAIKKAAMFGGKIELAPPTVPIEDLRIAKISQNALVWGVEKELNKITPEFKDTTTANERLYTADVFSNIFEGVDNLDAKAINQLEELVNSMRDYDYVLLIDIK